MHASFRSGFMRYVDQGPVGHGPGRDNQCAMSAGVRLSPHIRVIEQEPGQQRRQRKNRKQQNQYCALSGHHMSSIPWILSVFSYSQQCISPARWLPGQTTERHIPGVFPCRSRVLCRSRSSRPVADVDPGAPHREGATSCFARRFAPDRYVEPVPGWRPVFRPTSVCQPYAAGGYAGLATPVRITDSVVVYEFQGLRSWLPRAATQPRSTSTEVPSGNITREKA